MKQITNEGVTRYTHKDFIITIIEKPDEFEAWIQHKDYGIIMLMFGTPKAQKTINGEPYTIGYKGFCKMVSANFNDYAEAYTEQYGF